MYYHVVESKCIMIYEVNVSLINTTPEYICYQQMIKHFFAIFSDNYFTTCMLKDSFNHCTHAHNCSNFWLPTCTTLYYIFPEQQKEHPLPQTQIQPEERRRRPRGLKHISIS